MHLQADLTCFSLCACVYACECECLLTSVDRLFVKSQPVLCLQKRVERLELMHVRGNAIRYVHVPSKLEPDQTILSHQRRIVRERKLLELQAPPSAASAD